jgi:hypothetical protein
MMNVSRQVQSVPKGLKDPRLIRQNIRHEYVEYASGLQPLANVPQHLAWLVEVLQDVHTRDKVEAFGWEVCTKHVPRENLRTGCGTSSFRGRRASLDPMELPRTALKVSQESAGATTDVENTPSGFIL